MTEPCQLIEPSVTNSAPGGLPPWVAAFAGSCSLALKSAATGG